jgi:hypothetical protein
MFCIDCCVRPKFCPINRGWGKTMA